jgi:hypothetical protein
VERVAERFGEVLRGGDKVGESRGREVGGYSFCVLAISMDTYRPNTNQSDNKVLWPSLEQHLRDEKDIRDEGGLEHDGHVTRVKEFDGVGALLSTVLVTLYRDFDAESLEVDYHGKDQHSGHKVH